LQYFFYPSEAVWKFGEQRLTNKFLLTGFLRWLSYSLILLPIAAAFLYVNEFGVNVVYVDQWEMVTRFRNLSSGALTLPDLWAQHNQSRPFFPRVVMLLLGTLTDWNNLAEMYLILSCMCATLIALFFAFRESVGSKLFLFVPIAFLVFSLRQHWNMLLGYQLNFVFAATFGTIALYFLYVIKDSSNGRGALPVAMASATFAAFSSIQGLFVWPAGVLQILITPVEKRLKKFLAWSWGLVGVGEWILYFINYETGSGPSLLYPLTHPLTGAEYFLTLLGSSLFFPQMQGFAFVSGLLLVGVIAVGLISAYRTREMGNSFWIALTFFSLFTLVSITAGRADLGVESSLASRYTTHSLLLVVGIYGLLANLVIRERSHLKIASLALLSGLIVFSTPLSYHSGIASGVASREVRQEAAFVLSTYETQPDDRLQILRKQDPQSIRTRARMLDVLGYNVFSKP
jgi:hypothetical protein